MASGGWWVRPGWTGVPEQSATSPGQGWHGPYPTQDAAFKAEITSGPAGAPQRIGTVPGAPSYAPPNFSWLGVLGHWVGDFVLHLTDAHMWISLGWLLLGILLIVLGGYLIVRLSEPYAKAQSAITSTAGKL